MTTRGTRQCRRFHASGNGAHEILRAALELGDDVMSVRHAIKDALDPNGILNPGKGF